MELNQIKFDDNLIKKMSKLEHSKDNGSRYIKWSNKQITFALRNSPVPLKSLRTIRKQL